MAEYIEREALLNEAKKRAQAFSVALIYEAIKEAPACDVVEVVRCKDCIYHNVPPCPMRLSLNWTNDNDFCSYGERRSEE